MLSLHAMGGGGQGEGGVMSYNSGVVAVSSAAYCNRSPCICMCMAINTCLYAGLCVCV
jgi:hypothetical protein